MSISGPGSPASSAGRSKSIPAVMVPSSPDLISYLSMAWAHPKIKDTFARPSLLPRPCSSTADNHMVDDEQNAAQETDTKGINYITILVPLLGKLGIQV